MLRSDLSHKVTAKYLKKKSQIRRDELCSRSSIFLTFMFHILPVHIHSAPLQETLIRSAPLLKGTTELLVKRKKSISYSISPALNLRARKRIKPEALRLTKKKKLPFFFSPTAAPALHEQIR